MKPWLLKTLIVVGSFTALIGGASWFKAQANKESKPTETTQKATAKAALTVTSTTLKADQWAKSLQIQGNIHTWQDATISSETNGLKLSEISANVGDWVKKGQIVARYAPGTLLNDIAQSQAQIAEAQAALDDAYQNLKRAEMLKDTGAISDQQWQQYKTQVKSSQARLNSVKAQLNTQKTRLAQTNIVAPDDGIIASKTATLGAVTAPGQELFKLIRKGRLEWRAEVTTDELNNIKAGQEAHLNLDAETTITGTIRMLAPTIDTQTRTALVYIDLPKHPQLKAGMFVKGNIETGTTTVNTIPTSALVIRDGFHYVFEIKPGNTLIERKVKIGQIKNNQVDILSGLAKDAIIVERGVAFLNDGDLVSVNNNDKDKQTEKDDKKSKTEQSKTIANPPQQTQR